jgi:threonylcarbamoyladenosine tRNA methylthiotransferase MtaB
VTENADRECRQLVRRIQRKAPGSTVVVTGCYAQLKPNEIAQIPGVDLVLGAAEKFNIARHLREHSRGDSAKVCSCDIADVTGFNASHSVSDRTRSFLKVQDGCDYNCAFCTIPMARGRSRSDSVSNVVRQAEDLAREGVKEIVLTGVNLGDFGRGPNGDSEYKEDFLSLCRALDNVDGIDRFRISSIEPNLLQPETVEFVAQSRRFMPHFHIPLQSGSNAILGRMRRRYRRELYAERVTLIKSLMPHCAIGVDVITGFPTEGEAEFGETLDFIRELDVHYLHVFTYSERDGTKALEWKPSVPMQVRQERNKVLRNLSFMKMRAFEEAQRGTVRPVLFEKGVSNGMMEGYTDNYIRVSTPHRKEWVNRLLDWTL